MHVFRQSLAKLLTVAVVVQTVIGALFLYAPHAAASAPASYVVISEVKTNGAGDDEFVELYNPTGSAVTMSGWRLTRMNSTGTEANLVATLSGTIPAYGYFLITHPTSYTGATAADTVYSAPSNALTNNYTVLLYSDAGVTRVDKVGFGSAVDFEGAAFTTSPGLTESIERLPGANFPSQGNGVDTNNNSRDFATRNTPEPQNSTMTENPMAPAAAIGLVALDTPNDNGGSLTLTWTKSTDDGAGKNNVTAYNIWRSAAAAGPFTQIDSVANGVTTYIDMTATTGSAFYYQIEAIDGGYSTASAVSAAATSVDNLGPVISNLLPTDNSAVANHLPTASATIADSGTGINLVTTVLYLDDVQVDDYTDSLLAYTTPVALTQGNHRVRVVAFDMAGNMTQQSASFMVDNTAPTAALTIVKSAPITTTRIVSIRIDASDSGSGIAMMRVGFDGNVDNKAWVTFESELTGELPDFDGDHVVAIQLRDKAGNMSTVVKAMTTLDRSLVSAPSGININMVTAEDGKGIATMTWDVVPNATYYVIRYTDGTVLYGPFMTGDLAFVAGGLEQGKTYTFEIASVNRAGTVSSFTSAIDRTVVIVPASVSTSTESPARVGRLVNGQLVFGGPDELVALEESAVVGPQLRAKKAPTPQATISPTPAPEIKGGETSNSRDWTRVIVALSLLIIAAGVATGGWYLYQWWSSRPVDPKEKGKGGRW